MPLMQRSALAIAIDGLYGRGGTERQIVDIAIGMRGRGWRPTVVSRWPVNPDDEGSRELAEAGIPLVARLTKRDPPWRRVANLIIGRDTATAAKESAAYVWQTERIRALAADDGLVIHEVPYFGRMPHAAVQSHIALRLPVVHTILGTPSWPITRAAPWAVVTSDGAPAVAGEAETTWIPCTTSAPVPSARLTFDDGSLRLLFVGRLVASKGVDVLLDAIEPLQRRVSLVVVGDGAERAGLENRAAGLEARVRFAGSLPREAVLAEMQNAHVVVVPSRSEGVELQDGMPTVIAEALSQRRPVVGTRVGGIPMVLAGDDPPGWLVAPDDAGALRAVIGDLRPVSVTKASDAAERFYESRLAPEVVLDAYERCYWTAVDRALRFASGWSRGPHDPA